MLDVFTGYEKDILDVDELFEQNYSFTDSIKVGETISDIDELKEERRDKSNRWLGENIIDICACADIIFLALHGGAGENGQIQATLDLLGLKYTGSGYIGSLLAMDKDISKKMFVGAGVRTPEWLYFSAKDGDIAKIEEKIGYPCVVKPCSCGSSVGVSTVDNEDELHKALALAVKYENSVLVEKRIFGREFTQGFLGGVALPPVEIIPKCGFYDYANKYVANATEEICPAPIDKGLREKIDKKRKKSVKNGYFSRKTIKKG